MSRSLLVEELAASEGGIQAAYRTDNSEPRQACMTDEQGGNSLCVEGAGEGWGLLRGLAPVVHKFRSGSIALSLERPVDLSVTGMRHAMIEVLLMRRAALLVASENSSFGMAAHGWSAADDSKRRGQKQRGVVATRGARCYPLPSREPISDSGILMRDSRATCYNHRMLSYEWTWLPPSHGF